MARTELEKLADTNWVGTGELWLDPNGDTAHRYECAMAISANAISYTWSHEGKPHQGTVTIAARGATWSDSFHQPQTMECFDVPNAWGLFSLHYAYAAPGSPDWGWRTTLSHRPSGALVLQMTNITPWGEEGRAVRMIFTRKG